MRRAPHACAFYRERCSNSPVEEGKVSSMNSPNRALLLSTVAVRGESRVGSAASVLTVVGARRRLSVAWPTCATRERVVKKKKKKMCAGGKKGEKRAEGEVWGVGMECCAPAAACAREEGKGRLCAREAPGQETSLQSTTDASQLSPPRR